MRCSVCGKIIEQYNAIVYRKKLYHKTCLPASQQVVKEEIVEQKPEKKRVRKRFKKDKK